MSIRWDFGPLWRLKKEIRHADRAGPFHTMLKQWGVRYLAFTRRRFAREGNGQWARLAPPTVRRRRQGKRKSGGTKILRDTGTLLNALSPNGAGNLFTFVKSLIRGPGVRVGFSDSARHPTAGMSVAQLAAIHDEGKGNMPKRPILVPPDEPTKMQMRRDLLRAVAQSRK